MDVLGAERPISLGMLEDIAADPGQWILIHMGFPLERIDEAKAHTAMGGLETMGQAREPLERSVVPHA